MLLRITEFFAAHKSYAARIKFLKENYNDLFLQTIGSNQITRVYDILHNITTPPVCKTCKKENTKFDTFETGYKQYCCHKCAVANPETTIKRKTTNISKYGGPAPISNATINKKRKDTMIERYGVESPLQNKSLKEKSVKSYHNRSDTEKKLSMQKRVDSLVKNFGTANIWEVPEIVQKRKDTNRLKYGEDYGLQSDEVKAKSRQTRSSSFVNALSDKFPTVTALFNETLFLGVDSHNKYRWKCNVCDTEFLDHIDDGSSPVCPACTPQYGSVGESELIGFLTSIGITDMVLHDRSIISPKELDVYIPSMNVAIEYCGLYWHSSLKVDKNYHLQKMESCNKKGIRLITIFEDEWKNKRSICETRLRHILGKSILRRVYSRNTTISCISGPAYKEFLLQNHIQGYVPSTVKLGAHYNGELVAVMGFSAPRVISRHSNVNKPQYELLRFCSNAVIPGIASKLLKFFERSYSPSEIVSYCDLRWGTGNLYEMLGFKNTNNSLPNYWYSKNGTTRNHRFNFTKGKLVKLGHNPVLTEKEIMCNLGYYRIYDCGNARYIK